MREIKFRAWDKRTKKMVGEVVVFDFCEDRLIAENSSDNLDDNPLDAFELMQFTGLHDKNGKEIYEGDILAMPYGGHPARWTVGELSEYGLHFQLHTIKPYQSPHPYRDLRHFDKAEVIGNQWENPELLINN